jgi:hypothetical protein
MICLTSLEDSIFEGGLQFLMQIRPDLYQEQLGADFRRFFDQPKSKKALISQGL